MPIRSMRQRKETGLRKYIVPLLTEPVMRHLRGQEYDQLADLIYGPRTSYPDRELMVDLKALWRELREDILMAQAQYQPDKKPWAAVRFDSRKRRHSASTSGDGF